MTTSAQARWNAKNKEKLRQYQREWEIRNPSKYLWHAAKARAAKRGLAFTITPNDLPIPEFCPVFGIRLVLSSRRDKNRCARYDAPSVDRKDPTLGYVPGNVRVISWRANDLKGNGLLEEFELLVAYLKVDK